VKSKATMYNVDIFNQYGLEPPATLDEYREVNRTLLDNGVIPIAFGIKEFNYGWQFWDRVVAVVAGMDKIEEMLSGPGKFGSPEQVETLRVMREFAQEGWLGDALSYSNPESQTLFFNGEAAMYGIGTWNIGPFLEVLGEAPDFKLFEYGLFPFPGPEKSDTGKNIGTGGLAASSATEHPEAVKLFMQYWLSYENAMYFIEANYEPISSNVQALADSQDKLDYITILFGEILARDDLTPVTSAWGDWLCGAYYGQFLEDLQLIMFADDMTAEKGAQLLQDGYDECLAAK
jgi:ABC-type glycerol-3-phosphate transport system substrate-binding protein